MYFAILACMRRIQVPDAAFGKTDRRRALKKLKHTIFTVKSSPEAYRRSLEDLFRVSLLPNAVDCTETCYAGIPCDILIPQAANANRFVFYIHGGCFVGGSRVAWRSFCASLAHEAASRVCVPEFRLPPDHPFPAGLEDIDGIFRDLCSAQYSATPNPIFVIAADGSGASLACALYRRLPRRFQQYVRALVFFSPWFDVSERSPIVSQKRLCDELFSAQDLRRSAALYTDKANMDHPDVSPLHMGDADLSHFPPVYVQVGEKELLMSDTERFCRRLDELHIDCALDVWSDMMGLFQLADEYLPQSHLSVRMAGEYIRTL